MAQFYSVDGGQFTYFFFFFNDTPPTEIYSLPLHAALPISSGGGFAHPPRDGLGHLRARTRRREIVVAAFDRDDPVRDPRLREDRGIALRVLEGHLIIEIGRAHV